MTQRNVALWEQHSVCQCVLAAVMKRLAGGRACYWSLVQGWFTSHVTFLFTTDLQVNAYSYYSFVYSMVPVVMTHNEGAIATLISH